MTSRIFLVGLMGSGKTYWGEKFAASLHWQFIDLDKWIAENEQKSILEIFTKHGEAHFRLLEKKYLHEILIQVNHVVVAAGGGTPCFHKNMELMNRAGETYYLKANIETIVSRLRNEMQPRPLLAGKRKEELPEFFRQQLEQREHFYLQAKHILAVEKLNEEHLPNLLEI